MEQAARYVPTSSDAYGVLPVIMHERLISQLAYSRILICNKLYRGLAILSMAWPSPFPEDLYSL
ncbi:hypothetical protein NITHO_900004 [Nitrolancea hollandica Lb]|uniref:Uncharacterized protein n=1 Tax=Nitrolancea hollandica Lb TaxID=1129897 RepID=I4ENG6_9BACT|nr:hypothetical protein NITHO_900004 [Nitrolancea hollandica Lb]